MSEKREQTRCGHCAELQAELDEAQGQVDRLEGQLSGYEMQLDIERRNTQELQRELGNALSWPAR